MTSKLKRKFFNRSTLMVTKDLLGKLLVRRLGKKIISGKIVEVEAYIGPKDRASHAFGNKKTKRNEAEYLIGGHIYIYLVYGMHWQFNIVTGKEGSPECVLIRALEPAVANRHECSTRLDPPVKARRANGTNKKFVKIRDKLVKISELTNGPGKLCKWLGLNKSFNAEDLAESQRIWLEDGAKIKKEQIIASKRIGIDYAGKYWANKKWRFYIKDNKFVSKL